MIDMTRNKAKRTDNAVQSDNPKLGSSGAV